MPVVLWFNCCWPVSRATHAPRTRVHPSPIGSGPQEKISPTVKKMRRFKGSPNDTSILPKPHRTSLYPEKDRFFRFPLLTLCYISNPIQSIAMEPADIDWKKVDSRYIPDELYEHINAPKWLDLSSPDSSLDDAAWFCRPDCRHPKTFEDFQKLSPSPRILQSKRSSPAAMPLGERKSSNSQRGADNGNSLKRRGAIMSLLLPSDSPVREPAKKGNGKKLREDLENQDPNSAASNQPLPMKVAKEEIKSSAEKGAKVAVNDERERQPVRRLRSTMSARNLFSGRDILGQISEFCNEIKKLAVGREKSSAAAKAAAKEEEVEEEERKVLVDKTSTKGDDGPAKSRDEKLSVLKEVRAWPPTPQKIPSPSSRRLRSTKPAASGATSSPLNKPLKSAPKEMGILQELDQSREEKRALVSKDEECNKAAAAVAAAAESEEGSSMDMFWFLKPCTYLA